jgi:hypothetical protein
LVKLELSINDTIGPWQIITDEIPNNGHYQWTVPENMGSYEKCRIRYTAYTLTDSISAITNDGFYILGKPVTLINESELVPSEFKLHQNYPNPFNPSTKIKYTIPASSLNPFSKGEGTFVTLKVYDILGNKVATLVNEELPTGEYEVKFSVKDGSASGRNAAGHSGEVRNLTSGIYIYQLRAGSFIQTKKMVYLK